MQQSRTDHDQTPLATVPEMGLLGMPLLITSYTGLGEACMSWTTAPVARAVDFVNTQVVVMRRHELFFRRYTEAFDCFSPDGMPLIWCLNRAGAGLRDRVYGPTFMRKFLDSVPGNYTHYLLGGSEECGRRLKDRFEQANPGIQFVGEHHGRCSVEGQLDPAEEDGVLDEINRLSPDFVWVGFGTPKQQAWVHRYKSRVKRGVILTVGFGFDVNAGMKPDQPMWMQRLGLGWLFRLWSEPGRLLVRYLKYNTLFVWYLLWDGVRGKAFGKERTSNIEH